MKLMSAVRLFMATQACLRVATPSSRGGTSSTPRTVPTAPLREVSANPGRTSTLGLEAAPPWTCSRRSWRGGQSRGVTSSIQKDCALGGRGACITPKPSSPCSSALTLCCTESPPSTLKLACTPDTDNSIREENKVAQENTPKLTKR